jgi:hypothetical protein
VKIAELIAILQKFDPEKDACVAYPNYKGSVALEAVNCVHDNNGHAELSTSEAEALRASWDNDSVKVGALKPGWRWRDVGVLEKDLGLGVGTSTVEVIDETHGTYVVDVVVHKRRLRRLYTSITLDSACRAANELEDEIRKDLKQ